LRELAGWTLAGLVLAIAARGRRMNEPPRCEAATADEKTTWALGGVIALGLVLWSTGYLALISLLLPVKVVSDGPIYHLFFAARWWKEGRLSLVPVPFGESAATYFPANGDLWFTWLFVTWGGDRLARIGQAPFLALAGAAVYAMARRLGARGGSAMIATAWFVTVIPLLLFSFEANVDTIFIAGYLCGSYFLALYAQGVLSRGALVVAGLALGLAWGTKPTATVFIPPLLVLGWVFILRKPGAWSGKVLDCVVLVLAALVPCGYWFGRNLWLTGNPLYPLQVEVLGRVWLRGWYGTGAMARSQFYIPREFWRVGVDIVVMALDPRLVPVWAAALLGLWRVGRRGEARDGWIWGCAVLAVFNIALYWLLIPYRTQQRFMLQAAGLAAVQLAFLFDRSKAWQVVGVGLLAIHLVTPSNWPFLPARAQPPWSLTKSIPVNIEAPLRVPLDQEAWSAAVETPAGQPYLAVRLGLFVASLALARLWSRAAGGRAALGYLAAAGTTAGVLLGFGAWMWWGVGASRATYPMFEYFDAWTRLDLASGSRGTRVAYAGTNLPFYLMGKGLRNEVFYVSVDDKQGWLLHDYHRDAVLRGGTAVWETPRPGWDRLHPSFSHWVENLRRQRIRILVVARANRYDGAYNLADEEGFPIERVWADAHPEWFVPIFGVSPIDPRIKVYSVRLPETISTDPAPGRH
jgi:hypothetical protein